MKKKVTNVDVRHDQTAPVPMRTGGWESLNSLRNEIDRLLEDFRPGLWAHSVPRTLQEFFPATGKAALSPAVELVERDGGYHITAELPDMKPEDVEVRLGDGTVMIRGEKSEEMKEEKQGYLFSERRYGTFQRSLPLPNGIDADKVAASFENGVLSVTLPKTAEAKQKERKIEVKAA